MQAKAEANLSPSWCRLRSQFGDFECATYSYECRGHFVRETLCDFSGQYYLRIERGTKTPFWKFWGERVQSWITTYEAVSADLARAWAEKNSLHISGLND